MVLLAIVMVRLRVGVAAAVVEAAQAVVAMLRVRGARVVFAEIVAARRLVVATAKERPPAGGTLRLLSNHL